MATVNRKYNGLFLFVLMPFMGNVTAFFFCLNKCQKFWADYRFSWQAVQEYIRYIFCVMFEHFYASFKRQNCAIMRHNKCSQKYRISTKSFHSYRSRSFRHARPLKMPLPLRVRFHTHFTCLCFRAARNVCTTSEAAKDLPSTGGSTKTRWKRAGDVKLFH